MTLFEGEEIKKLIPQREPIIMVSHFFEASSEWAKTGLQITEDNIFCKNGKLTEPGLIEHIAQSAVAFAGFNATQSGSQVVLGYIGEIKNFALHQLPPVGSLIETRISVVSEVMNVMLMKACTILIDTTIAECSIKLFMDR